MNLALNNLQWLICHKTKPNEAEPNPIDNDFNEISIQISSIGIHIMTRTKYDK